MTRHAPHDDTTAPQTAPDRDQVAAFGADLRALRLEADSPTLVHLQNVTGISRTALSDAFKGKKLPSARTVDRIVRVCGGDPAEWVARRDTLAAAMSDTSAAEAPAAAEGVPDVEDASPAPATGGFIAARTAWLLAAIAFVLGIGLSVGASTFVTAGMLESARAEAHADGAEQARKELTESPINPRAQINVTNGVDPALTPCVNDAKVAASSPRDNHTLIEIIWSNKCYAGWARVTRYDEKISGNSITVSIYPETAAQGPDRQTAVEPNVQGAYTTLVVRPTPQTRLCAVGSITIDGESIDLGEPLCT